MARIHSRELRNGDLEWCFCGLVWFFNPQNATFCNIFPVSVCVTMLSPSAHFFFFFGIAGKFAIKGSYLTEDFAIINVELQT